MRAVCASVSSLISLKTELVPGCPSVRRTHPVKLSITHNFRPDRGAQRDVGQAR
jgi:hypothetical protein